MGPSTNDQGRRVSEQSSISVKKGEGKQKKSIFYYLQTERGVFWKMSSLLAGTQIHERKFDTT